jgi:hypothetical protein
MDKELLEGLLKYQKLWGELDKEKWSWLRLNLQN